MGTVTKQIAVENARSFRDRLTDASRSYYVYVAKPLAWDNESSPPTEDTTLYGTSHEVYSDILYARKVTPNDVALVVPRNDWTSNTVYTQWDPEDPDLEVGDCFVVTDADDVYKCIYNSGVPSLVKPFVKDTSKTFTTSDGYVWKYLYTIDSDSMEKFATSSWIPVLANTEVTVNSKPGTIDAIEVEAAGAGYTSYTSGFLRQVVNSSVIILDSAASSNNNHYVGSSVYLRNGSGAGQLKLISAYDGAAKRATLDTPLELQTALRVSDVFGSFITNTPVYQLINTININSIKGAFYTGDTFIQTDTGATGRILSANSSVVTSIPTNVIPFTTGKPIVLSTLNPVSKAGNVTIALNSNVVVGSNTSFTNSSIGYTVGEYIQVGGTASRNVRRITSIVNNTYMTVATPFTYTAIANAHFLAQIASETVGFSSRNANGIVLFSDSSGREVEINSLTGQFQFGEKVLQANSSTANAVIAFANSTVLRLTEVQGTFNAGGRILGVTSAAAANIVSVTSDPNITVGSVQGEFVSQAPIVSISGTPPILMVPGQPGAAVANVVSTSVIPNDSTNYYISPTVTITGDGSNALAYSTIGGSANGVLRIEVIDNGRNYTYATAVLSSNTLLGSDAELRPLLSPVAGHGADLAAEMNANSVSVSVAFGNSFSEGYKHIAPVSIRRIGLIQDPLIDDVVLTVSNADRVNFEIRNASNSFSVGEIVRQGNNAGVVVLSNTLFVQVSGVANAEVFIANTAGDTLIGVSSGSTANVATKFALSPSNTDVGSRLVQDSTESYGVVVTANSSSIKLTSSLGTFASNTPVRIEGSNTAVKVDVVSLISNYANVASESYNLNISMLSRVSMSSNTGAFTIGEKVTQTDLNSSFIASGTVVKTSEVDILYENANGTFSLGQTLTQGAANGIILYANSSYLKLTNVQGSFTPTGTVSAVLGPTANVVARAHVLNLMDTVGTFIDNSTDNRLLGASSNSIGFVDRANTVTKQDFIRNSGKVLYIDNEQPVSVNTTSIETVDLVFRY